MCAPRTAMPTSRKECARVDDRKIMNAIFYVLRTGMSCRDLRYGPCTITADKAYDDKRRVNGSKNDGALPVIPSRSNATKKAHCPRRFYRQPHKIQKFLLPRQRLAVHCHEI